MQEGEEGRQSHHPGEFILQGLNVEQGTRFDPLILAFYPSLS